MAADPIGFATKTPVKAGKPDWAGCENVERYPGVISGTWVVKGTRISVEAILDNVRAGYSAPAMVANIFPDVSVEIVQSIVDFAKH